MGGTFIRELTVFFARTKDLKWNSPKCYIWAASCKKIALNYLSRCHTKRRKDVYDHARSFFGMTPALKFVFFVFVLFC